MSRFTASAAGELDVSWDDMIALAPTYGLLSAEYFSDPAALLRESLVVHRDGAPIFLLPLASTEGGWVSHPETFACGLLPLEDATVHDVWPAVRAVQATGTVDRLRVRLRPSIVDPAFAEAESGAWRTQRCAVVRSAAIMALDLTADAGMGSRRRRALAKATRNGMAVRRARDQAELRSAWACIEDVYARRGLSDLLSLERVQALHDLPTGLASVYAVEVDGRVVGAALGYRFGQSYRLPIYGMMDVPEAAGGTESIISFVGEQARLLSCSYLDLGTSTDPRTGETVVGIAKFKYEMGARPWPVEHLMVELAEGR